MKNKLKALELHVSHACNLTCVSCSHYSNHTHNGNLSINDAEKWISAWSDRISIETFRLLGGEPLINKNLIAFIPLIRSHWNETAIEIVTNGFLLHQHPALAETLANAGNSKLIISIHHNDPTYLNRIQPNLDLAKSWRNLYGIQIEIRDSFSVWTERYQGFGSSMEPFKNNNPRKSWEICPARDCKQLHQGLIYKCGPLAYLGMQDAKFGLSQSWAPYLNYTPLSSNCTEEELRRFIAMEDENFCAMCTSERRPLAKPIPLNAKIST